MNTTAEIYLWGTRVGIIQQEKEPAICSYEMAAQYMRELNLSMKEMEQFFARMVFNCLAVNQDDHVKNVSFLMDRTGEWRLSPAYDITFSYNPTNRWLRAHQMSVNQKTNYKNFFKKNIDRWSFL